MSQSTVYTWAGATGTAASICGDGMSEGAGCNRTLNPTPCRCLESRA